mgnify:CR=1 FL=1
MTTMSFFMIGSWTEGMFHFEKIKPHVLTVKPGHIDARVYRLPVGYPVLVEKKSADLANSQSESQPNSHLIHGQILEVIADDTLLALLDSFHGVHPADSAKSLFHRKSFPMTEMTESSSSELQVYMMNPAKLPKNSVEISGSCWKKSLTEVPPLPATLTEKQKEILRQLGNVKGRDVVLVKDLTLYRDLMKMELIVDKGRRLALSPLGKDVFQYLS